MTISESYLAQQKALHENPDYGVASLQFAPLVKKIADQIKAKSISDYGAGKCRLQGKLHELGMKGFDYFPFDPVFPDYGPARAADLVCCIDVLEHIEPEHLDAVLDDLKRITVKLGFLTVHVKPAVKVLPDGRNAHLIQKPASWWLPKLCSRFEIAHLQRVPMGFWVFVEPIHPGAETEATPRAG